MTERNLVTESETHIHTLRERHTHLRGRDTHSEKHTKTLPRRPTTLRQTHNETETHS